MFETVCIFLAASRVGLYCVVCSGYWVVCSYTCEDDVCWFSMGREWHKYLTCKSLISLSCPLFSFSLPYPPFSHSLAQSPALPLFLSPTSSLSPLLLSHPPSLSHSSLCPLSLSLPLSQLISLLLLACVCVCVCVFLSIYTP